MTWAAILALIVQVLAALFAKRQQAEALPDTPGLLRRRRKNRLQRLTKLEKKLFDAKKEAEQALAEETAALAEATPEDDSEGE